MPFRPHCQGAPHQPQGPPSHRWRVELVNPYRIENRQISLNQMWKNERMLVFLATSHLGKAHPGTP